MNGIRNSLPAERSMFPILVYMSTDLGSRTYSDVQIGLIGMIQTCHEIGGSVLRWTPDNPFSEGNTVYVNQAGDPIQKAGADLHSIRQWPGGVTFVAIWPGNDRIVKYGIMLFTGQYGRPRVVREASGIELHTPIPGGLTDSGSTRRAATTDCASVSLTPSWVRQLSHAIEPRRRLRS